MSLFKRFNFTIDQDKYHDISSSFLNLVFINIYII